MKSTLEMGIRKPLRTPSEGAHSLETQAPGLQQTLLAQHRRDHLLARLLTGRSPGRMINYLAEGSANASSVTSFIPGYKVVSGLDLDAYQVHARCILLDTKTGYRSQYLAISGVVNL